MARFVRDEKRTYPFTWLIIGSLFAGSAVWAVYAEMVTRVPWQVHQQAYFDQELESAKQAHARAKKAWDEASTKDPLKSQLAERAKIQEGMASGPYADAKAKLAQLDIDFANAEKGKTFGASDLDEAYYYRNLAEYHRDEEVVAVYKAFKDAFGKDPKALSKPNAIYKDPPNPALPKGKTVAMHHLDSEIIRAQTRAKAVQDAISEGHGPEINAALEKSLASENDVIKRLEVEKIHQAKIDAAIAKMTAIDGPIDPRVVEKDPKKRPAAVAAARAKVCKGKEETRHCLKWLTLEPIDKKLKKITISIAKAERGLKDAELRLGKAKAKAQPEFDPKDLLGSLVGPYQIQQVVTHWMDHERDVDIEQVDRCQTCHMGIDNANFTAPHHGRAYRTHPRRKALLGPHPVDKFGCTACHQGQGRSTDDLAHSKWTLELHHGKERWHYAGDHYWEDPLLPVGHMTKIVIDEDNDSFEIKIGKGKKTKVTLEHGVRATEEELFAQLQEKLAAAMPEKYKADYKAVVRHVDNRITIGLVQKDEYKEIKKPPRMVLNFPKHGFAEMLGFGRATGFDSKTQTAFTAEMPPVQPVRAANKAAQGTIVDHGDKYTYVPPRGDAGLQLPDEMRNRFIQALPEVEAGCYRCHQADTDLVPRHSQGEHIEDKLAYQKAQVARDKDPEAYQEAHRSLDLPKVRASAEDSVSLAPTLDEGRAVFRQLNCTGCHILEGFQNNKNAGPKLDDISAKTTPEFLLTWIRYPRGWRSKTSMPNLWPAPIEPASKVPYAKGTPEHTKWLKERKEETTAIAAFLWDRSEDPKTNPARDKNATALREKIKGYANVDGATAEIGKKVFEAYGCQGCHADTEGGASLPEAWRKRERDIAPTLANIGGKANEDWIAYWVENPDRYWHGTSMPNLRLSRKEAASVAKYLVTLKSKPLAAVPAEADDVKRVSDPKLRHAEMSCTVAGGKKMSWVECGEKLINHRGCFGCHQIGGFEGAAPIGPELTGFAKKDITTLDFGYAIADHHMQTTETFATLKIDSPRIYARDRIELKMGDFDASAREIRALTVFIKGMVPNKPAEAFDPKKKKDFKAALEGRQLVNDLNCRGCHIIEGRGADIDGWRTSLLTQDAQRRAPWLNGEGSRVQPEWLFDFLRKPGEHGIRPWLHPEWVWGDAVPDDKMALRMPTFNLSADQWTAIVKYFATWDRKAYPFPEPHTPKQTKEERLYALTGMNDAQAGNCLSCHYLGDFPKERGAKELEKMAPNFAMVRHRLRPQWVKQWLLRPQNYLPYTKMTAFWANVDRPKTAKMWPKENDPFMSPPAKGWDKVPLSGDVSGERQVELVRDFLFSLPAGASFPKPGEEASSPLVDLEAARRAAENAKKEDEDEDEDEGDDEEQTGMAPRAPGLPGRL